MKVYWQANKLTLAKNYIFCIFRSSPNWLMDDDNEGSRIQGFQGSSEMLKNYKAMN